MALAWSWVVGQLLGTVLLLTYRPGRFRAGLASATRCGALLAFGLPLAGANIIAFSVLNVDYVVVGRVLGATALGLYVLAFNISGWPMNLFGAVVRSVSLPGFAHLQRDGEDMPGRFAAALAPGGRHHPAHLLPVGRGRPAAGGHRLRAALGAGRHRPGGPVRARRRAASCSSSAATSW